MANKRLNATITIGGAITSGLKAALGSTRDGLNQIGKAVTDLKQRQKELNAVVAQQEKLGSAGNALKVQYANQELALINKQIDALRKKQSIIQQTQASMSAASAKMASAGMALGAAAAAAATAFVPIIQAAAFEKAMLGVAKQIDGARDDGGKLTQVYFDMARQVQLLGRELPLATNEIADMVAAGARMGVAKDELIGFTRTAAMMASAFDLPAGELAEQMGKIATLFKIPIPNIGELADVINYLDDNAISKGGDIIEVLKRIGGTAQFVKMPAKEAAALASTFLTLGSTAEIAGTAANAVMRELSIATMQPKRFQAGLAAIKMDAKKVQKDMAKDATGTILKVLDKLNALPEETRLTVATQLFGKEYGDDIAKLAEGVKEYRRQLELAASDKAMGSMAREHQARLQTTYAQWEIAKNRITEVGVNIGSILLPAINDLLGVFGGATTAMADFVREHQTLVGNIATAAGTILGSIVAWKGMAFGIAAVTFAFNALKLAMATNPIGLLLVGLTTAAVLIYKNWEPLREFFAKLWADITASARQAIDWIIAKIEAVGQMWQNTKRFFGFGEDAPPAKSVGAVPQPPAVPRMATAPNYGASYNAPQTNTFNITQLPGQDSKALADEVARRLAEKQGVARRSIMFDPALGY
ncbi:phage tail tape measure protein [Microvirga alba]|uniref:Phage tail tape measure protein n=1 Tax=Microvirga alba TaxID=2791025 RepID=A0A931FUG6_9HYPH|nr:phage tail tape measure protein [Microvirga alba]MBF9235596.1 phage tail tape measure protein [Microvirga alba]